MSEGQKDGDSVSGAKKEYLKILLQQYSEAWESIRNYSNSVWQIPMFLLTAISILGIAYGQLILYPTARIILLFVALGFTLVSTIALVKHRFFEECNTDDFKDIERQLKELLKQDEFKSFFENENAGKETKDQISFKEIYFKSSDLAKNRCCIYHTSAYKWQLGLSISILLGIMVLLLGEFIIQILTYWKT